METFVGRAQELRVLRDQLAQVKSTGRASFVWMRGRRRVGKSRLVQEFCDSCGERYCFYQAPRRPRPNALADFVEAVAESTLPASSSFIGVTYDSWPAALRGAMQEASAPKPLVIVLDELPYLAELDDGFTADLQKAWDLTIQSMPVMLICIGSDVRMMESLVGEPAPLHNRPTREMRVSPLDPAAVASITGASDATAALDRYLIIGGFPLLAGSWPQGVGMSAFLADALADDQTPFATTALRITTSEFRSEQQAAKVIAAIGHGEGAYGRIQARSGVRGNTLTEALDVLIARKALVAKDLPYAIPPGKKAARYTVADPYMRFWLRFVGPHLDELSRGRPDLVIDRIERDWAVYRGRAIEPLVRVALERLLDEPSLSDSLDGARHVGAWWRRDHSIEVDLVGGDRPEPKRIGFVGSIKWRDREPFSAADLRQLQAGRAHVPGAEGAKLVAVSRSGFEDGLGLDASFGPDQLLAAW